MKKSPFKIQENVQRLSEVCLKNSKIDNVHYSEYDVKKGLRDLDGRGVLAGLTNISMIQSQKMIDGKLTACEGVLQYRGIDIKELVAGFQKGQYFGFEEITYLLLFGELPTKVQLKEFRQLLADKRTLPKNYVRDVIMKSPSKDIMNQLSRSVLTLASYDPNVSDLSIENVLNQSLLLISVFPLLAVYSYQAYAHSKLRKSLYIHNPDPKLSTAENILRLLRPDKKFTEIEAQILDLALVLHMEHGGGNNSTFTNHVVTSSGTDTYATVAASLSSLKGSKHGGANIKVTEMMRDIKENVEDICDEQQLSEYLAKILRKEAFDKKGLIYGMGHAVYSISDPRADLFRTFVGKLADDKGLHDEFEFYAKIERLAPKVIASERNIYKGVSANVDFYSGFVYHMLGLPDELYTPIFAIARIVGWSAHRIEELINMNKIIRPAYESVLGDRNYVEIEER
ncbi:citrate synthase [Pilibacter termitis]|uniref:Citrate synthase n=1 Tax=Pilibacter termitis TaxID=263852 RepID=A0A1T4MGY3_9ENTE|nr:citrate/2-methylcitrate synthase [Pilibacter termitis]SJZ66024.1 citrate synthase [Pilibacter termitis]